MNKQSKNEQAETVTGERNNDLPVLSTDKVKVTIEGENGDKATFNLTFTADAEGVEVNRNYVMEPERHDLENVSVLKYPPYLKVVQIIGKQLDREDGLFAFLFATKEEEVETLKQS